MAGRDVQALDRALSVLKRFDRLGIPPGWEKRTGNAELTHHAEIVCEDSLLHLSVKEGGN